MDIQENLLEIITLSYKDVEEQIKTYPLTFDKTKINIVEWQLKLPVFVTSFYNYLKSNGSIPNQNDYWLFYVAENKAYLTSLNLPEEEKKGVRARVFRTYPSLVRDLHLGLYLKNNHLFRSVFYNELIDVEYGIDIIVENDSGTKFGLNLFIGTKRANDARRVKQHRLKKSLGIICLDFPLARDKRKICGDFFLYADDEIQKKVEEIQNYKNAKF